LFGILKTREHNVSETGSVSVLRSEGRYLPSSVMPNKSTKILLSTTPIGGGGYFNLLLIKFMAWCLKRVGDNLTRNYVRR
jgi:hypothetical protein